MSEFIVKSNLPESEVKILISGKLPDEITAYLKKRKIVSLKIAPVIGVDKACLLYTSPSPRD